MGLPGAGDGGGFGVSEGEEDGGAGLEEGGGVGYLLGVCGGDEGDGKEWEQVAGLDDRAPDEGIGE